VNARSDDLAGADHQAVLEHDLETAYAIQQSFLPRRLPDLANAELAAVMQPARLVGGDFYDVIPLHHGRVGMLVADVSGKGVPAALYMALARTLLHAYSLEARPRYLSDALESDHIRHLMQSGSLGALAALGAVAQTNEYLVTHHADLSMFLTLFYGIYDPENRLFTYVNAGHNPPLLCNAASATCDWLKPTDMSVGLLPGRPFEAEARRLAPGDTMVMYSDGITEAFNGEREMFGTQRLVEVVRSHEGLPAPALQRAIADAVADFAGAEPQSDDITLLVLRCLPD
jgi:sigma-B regulation protein RsbU (phosphoserine phosphatase)